MPTLVGLLADHFGVNRQHVQQSVALTDLYHVASVLREEGVEGLRKIRLQPLSPVRPALAGGTTDQIRRFPVWVERKYDGVRLLLHKSTGERGSVLCAAYTRNGNDWLELAPGLEATIRMLPVQNVILDGELHGSVFDERGARPATVYEVVSALKESRPGTSLKFVAFDVLYRNGTDLTKRRLRDRRAILANLFGMIGPCPLPLTMAEGQLATNMSDVQRLYHHFRAQGHEGVIVKDLDAPYVIGSRDPNWLKKKAEITLDLALLGATYAVSDRHPGVYGSYVMGARTGQGPFVDLGDVDGVDRLKDLDIQHQIMRDGLLTGRRIERKLTEGTAGRD